MPETTSIRELEKKAQEFVRFVYSVTEERLAEAGSRAPALQNKAIAAAALAVDKSIKAFIATLNL